MSNAIRDAEKGYTYKTPCSLDVITCGVCGIPFALPTALNERGHKHPADDPNTVYFWCPAGHQLRYDGRSETVVLEERLEHSRDRAGRLAHRAEQAEASAKAHRGAATRARNERDKAKARIAKGVCPCCNRHFKDVERHMATRHPDYHLPGESL